jgi:hypothetical protein
MADDDRLRIGRWVDHGEVPEQVSPGGGAEPGDAGDVTVEGMARAYGDPRYGADDRPTTGVPTVGRVNGDDDDAYRGHRRAAGDDRLPLRRAIAVAIMVGALLIGVGVMARSVSGPEGLPGPPPTPDGQVEPTSGTARLVAAPTGSPESPESTTGAPAPTPPAGDEDPSEESTPEPTPPTPTTPPTTPPIASYESEDGDLNRPHTQVVSRDDASGGRVVQFTTGSPMGSVTHQDVTVGTSGRYRLTIFYFTGESRSVHVIVNGVGNGITLAPPGDPDTAGAVTLSIELTSGANTIEIVNDDAQGLQLDRITIAE